MWQRSWIMNFMTSYSWKPGTSSTSSTVWRPRAPRKSDDSEANEHFETPAVQCTCFEAIVRLECWKLTWEVRKPLDMDARENYVSFACYFFQCFHWDISRSQSFNEICKADSSVLHSQRQKRNCFNLLHAAVRTWNSRGRFSDGFATFQVKSYVTMDVAIPFSLVTWILFILHLQGGSGNCLFLRQSKTPFDLGGLQKGCVVVLNIFRVFSAEIPPHRPVKMPISRLLRNCRERLEAQKSLLLWIWGKLW